MDMFGISFSEIVLIFVIAIVIFGPQQIPQIATKLGTLFFTMRQLLYKIKQDIYQQSGFNEFNQAKDGIINTYQQLKTDIISNIPQPVNYIHPMDTEEIQTQRQMYQPELDFQYQPELF